MNKLLNKFAIGIMVIVLFGCASAPKVTEEIEIIEPPTTEELNDQHRSNLEQINLHDVVMTTSEKFDAGNKLSQKTETSLGNFVSDAQVAYLKDIGVEVDFALTNGGNIRSSLPKGDVTKENILTTVPYKTYIYVLDLNGSDVIELFNYIGSLPQVSSGWAQVSAQVSYTITYTNGNGSVSNVLINGLPIDETKTYKIAVNNYLANGGEGYTMLANATSVFDSTMLMSDMVLWYATTLPPLAEPKINKRITIIGGIDL